MPLFICAATYENSLEDDEFVTSGFLEYNFHLVPDCFPVDVNNVAAWDDLWRIHSHFAAAWRSAVSVQRHWRGIRTRLHHEQARRNVFWQARGPHHVYGWYSGLPERVVLASNRDDEPDHEAPPHFSVPLPIPYCFGAPIPPEDDRIPIDDGWATLTNSWGRNSTGEAPGGTTRTVHVLAASSGGSGVL